MSFREDNKLCSGHRGKYQRVNRTGAEKITLIYEEFFNEISVNLLNSFLKISISGGKNY